MQVFAGHGDQALTPQPTAVAIGVFDGVHLGHQALLAEVGRLARVGSGPPLRAMAFTFDPHPARLLRPSLAPPLIEPIGQRLARLAAAGLDAAVVQPFDPPLAAMTARAFFEEILMGRLGARAVVVGEGFRFGRGQQGEVASLVEMGAAHGVTVSAVGHVRHGGIEVSSTKVRAFVQAGQVDGAALLLGRPFEVMGAVAQGARRGRTLGYPTANLAAAGELMPARGVYAAWARRGQGPPEAAVVNVGTAPTFGASTKVTVEAHLLDHTGGDFYGQSLVLALVGRIRQERKFSGPEALVQQIQQDVATCRRVLAA